MSVIESFGTVLFDQHNGEKTEINLSLTSYLVRTFWLRPKADIDEQAGVIHLLDFHCIFSTSTNFGNYPVNKFLHV